MQISMRWVREKVWVFKERERERERDGRKETKMGEQKPTGINYSLTSLINYLFFFFNLILYRLSYF